MTGWILHRLHIESISNRTNIISFFPHFEMISNITGSFPHFESISNITSNQNQNMIYHCVVSIIAAIFMCKIVYDLTAAISQVFVKGYNKLSDIEKLEWCDRGFSTFHAIALSLACIYFSLFSDLFDESLNKELITHRRSISSDSVLSMSFGYFLSDLALILWHFPALGGLVFVLHHVLAMSSIFISLRSGQALIYALMLLFTETTTPLVNLRWYLVVVGKKNSKLYIFNGLALFFGWLVARILLFTYYFYHLYWHFDEVKTLFPSVICCSVMVPPVLAVLNLIWFFKIAKGTVKTLSKLRHSD